MLRIIAEENVKVKVILRQEGQERNVGDNGRGK